MWIIFTVRLAVSYKVTGFGEYLKQNYSPVTRLSYSSLTSCSCIIYKIVLDNFIMLQATKNIVHSVLVKHNLTFTFCKTVDALMIRERTTGKKKKKPEKEHLWKC